MLLLAPQSPPGGHSSPAAEPAHGVVGRVGPAAGVGVTPPEKLKRGGGPSARDGPVTTCLADKNKSSSRKAESQ